jgi:hypothetical protein
MSSSRGSRRCLGGFSSKQKRLKESQEKTLQVRGFEVSWVEAQGSRLKRETRGLALGLEARRSRRTLEAGACRLEAKCRRVDARDSKLEAGSSRLEARESRLEARSSRLHVGGRRLEASMLELETGGSRLKAGGSRQEARDLEAGHPRKWRLQAGG